MTPEVRRMMENCTSVRKKECKYEEERWTVLCKMEIKEGSEETEIKSE